MTTRTEAIVVTHEWQQLTDGSQSRTLQALSVVMIADADTQPDRDTLGHSVVGFAAITPPTVLWCRTLREGETATVVMT